MSEILTIRSRMPWFPASRGEALDQFRVMVDGLESEAMSAGLDLDYRTLRFEIERLEYDVEETTFEDDEPDGTTYTVTLAEAEIQGVKVGESLKDDNDEKED